MILFKLNFRQFNQELVLLGTAPVIYFEEMIYNEC